MEPEPTQESKEAVHAAKNAAQAIETAREAQMVKMVEDTALRTKEALLEGLKEVFGNSDSRNPDEMTVLVHRIPILCVRIDAMDKNIESIQSNMTWAVRIVIGAVILALLKLVIF